MPQDVRALFSQHKHEAGLAGQYAWAFSRSQLVVWQPGGGAAPWAHRLPYASSAARHHVAVLPPAAGALGAALQLPLARLRVS